MKTPIAEHTIFILAEDSVEQVMKDIEREAKDKRNHFFAANIAYTIYVLATLGWLADPIMKWLL